MTARRATLLVGGLVALLAVALSAAERPQFTIVVGAKPVEVFRDRSTRSEVIESASTGACLDVLSEVEGWFWVMLPPDAYGTRRSGWVSGRVVRRPSPGAPVPPAVSCGEESSPRVADPSALTVTGRAGAAAPTRPPSSVIASAPAPTLADAAAAIRPEPEPAARPVAPSPGTAGAGSTPARPNAPVLASANNRTPVETVVEPEPESSPPGGPHVFEGAVTIGALSFFPNERSSGSRGIRAAVPPGGGKGPTNGAPPYPRPPRSAVPDDELQSGRSRWFTVQSLRGNLGGGFESVSIGYNTATSTEQGVLGVAGINGSFAIVDPRLLTINAGADLQQSSVRRSTENTGGAFRNYRVEIASRTGQNSPLHLFANRSTADLNLQPLGPQDLLTGRTRGTRTTRGVSWLISTPRLPKLEFTAVSSRQVDTRDPQLGFDSTYAESRANARALDDTGWVRYDVNYSHRAADYSVPEANVGTRTSDDVLNAAVHLTPGSTLAIDASGRASRYRDDVNSTGRNFDGTGGSAAIRWQFRPRFAAAASYDFSTNLIEAVLSASAAPPVPGIGVPVAGDIYRAHTLFQHVDGRVGYVTDHAAIEAIVRDISYGVPAFQPQTLSDLRTAGASIRGQRPAGGFDLGAGVDFAVGTARSNRSLTEPYREWGGQASIARAVRQAVRVTAEGSLRRASPLVFYPLLLQYDSLGFRLESQYPRWAQAQVAVRWTSGLRDSLDTGIRERHLAYTLGLSGGRYDLALDVGTDQSVWVQLSPDLIGNRIDAAILMATRPELYVTLFGGTEQLATLTGTIRPFKGFSVRARAIEQHRRYQGQDEWDLMGGQLSGTYQLRELQIEFGWERMDSSSLFYNTRDRRIYVRVRRDVSVF